MFELISQLNLSYLCVFALIIISAIYVLTLHVNHLDIRIHEFNVAETKPLRGLMALLIILTHVSFKFPQTQPTWLFTSFGAPVVSVFFFLGGYGLTISLMKKGNAYLKGFLKRSLTKLAIPFLLASAMWIPLACLFLEGNLKQMMLGFLTFNPPLPYSWFVYALILLYIFFYIASKSTEKLLISSGIQVATTFAMIVIFRLLDFGVYWYISLFAFNAGNIYAVYHKRANSILVKKPLLTLLTVLAILVIMDLFKIRTALLAVIPFGIVVSILVLGGGAKCKILNFLGSISYEIYLMHGIAITLLDNQGLDWWIYLVLACAITIVSAYLLHEVCRLRYGGFKLLPKH
jgi:peptidoglycan/LPS O-acetylase OafA/YrhL